MHTINSTVLALNTKLSILYTMNTTARTIYVNFFFSGENRGLGIGLLAWCDWALIFGLGFVSSCVWDFV